MRFALSRAKRVPVESKTSRAKSIHTLPGGRFNEVQPGSYENCLFFQGKVAQELSFAGDVVEQRFFGFIHPLGVQVQLYFMIASFLYQFEDFREGFRPKPGREEGLNEEHFRQAVLSQLMQLIRQTVITPGSGTINIPLKCAGEFGVNVLPTIAP